ncbi:NapC/NirT family cytochrome c [Coralliovum pocilloporae]|uniref:NapC/NirT family cytochrome c n=1 Tax=Coralliovum pocilloporae TaxID=3066369 RepID=UPI0033070F52
MGDQAKPGWWARWRKVILFGTPLSAALIFFSAGIVFWGGFNTAMEATNTLPFCISCHEMENTVYQEYKTTIHYQNRTGVRATCSDCHVPDPWVHKMVRKVQASRELYGKVVGTIDTPEKFEAKRLELAKRVWKTMKATDSRECRNCHTLESMAPEYQRPRARKQHLNAIKTGQTCIDCHKGIAHNSPRHLLTEEELEELEKPDMAFARDIPETFLASLKKIETLEAEAAAKAEADAKAAQDAVKARIAAAVAKREEEVRAELAGTVDTSSGAGASGGADALAPVDWDSVDSKNITLFYPGQASFEWVQTGKDHGGARPFTKAGDRCSTCHAKEVKDMGAKIVSGSKAEETPIPGKPGHVDMTVQATHDADNLYLRFQWQQSAHAPVPFIDGGKLDPANETKIAVMIAGKDIKYAEQAGCWVTCHHDSRYMPHAPKDDQLKAVDFGDRVDVSDGIRKYLAQSRTKVEVKGRRGKIRGGWDKLRDKAEIDEARAAGQFMDLLRYRSGETAENGSIQEDRIMADGVALEAAGTLDGDIWTVVMKRPLKTGEAGDVDLEAGQQYVVGFAIHDDYASARFHHVSLEFTLGLDDPSAEINVQGQ